MVVIYVMLERIKIPLAVEITLRCVQDVNQVPIMMTRGRLHAVSVYRENMLKEVRQPVRSVMLERIKIPVAVQRTLRCVQAVNQVPIITTRGRLHAVIVCRGNILKVVRQPAWTVVLEGNLRSLFLASVEIAVVGNTLQ